MWVRTFEIMKKGVLGAGLRHDEPAIAAALGGYLQALAAERPPTKKPSKTALEWAKKTKPIAIGSMTEIGCFQVESRWVWEEDDAFSSDDWEEVAT